MDSPAPRSAARAALLAVIALALVLIGGGLAVALGIGRGEPAPDADSVDAGFSRDMARHHLQGVQMANLVPDRSEDREVEMLAFDISATQTNQAGRMQGWLDLWDVSPSGGEIMAWMGDGHAHGAGGHDSSDTGRGALMPGMATDEELANLRSLTGTAFDVEFLRLMIRHHQGGFDMAEYAVEHADVTAVRNLARAIAQSQGAETRTMTDMLTARGGTPLPEP
ncbi:DUF305 domain-containing protein [Candidatus Blastococcus massiliensis]|uniref:DUF305 domain-containing protein n=1 Tax=Candidatus Blastococcus massiliensis TaxID=1470358 RepID=UPI0004B216D1|nr:DUF305 domain-containing protein [Candidatus Blastococcus massiliensis]